jgi:O-antigen/teichoic acid export membrane protein
MSIVWQSSFYFLCQIVSFGLTILSDIILSRIIGPSGRGIYSTITSFVLLAVGLLILGMGYAPTYILAKRKATLKEVHSSILLVIVTVSVLVVILPIFFRHLLRGSIGEVIQQHLGFILILIPLGCYKQCWYALMIGMNKVIDIGKAIVIFAFIGSVLFILFLYILKLGLTGALLALVITDSIIILIMLYKVYVMGGNGFSFNLHVLREIVTFGGISHIGNIAVQIYQRFGVFALGAIAGMTQVGYYTLATNLAEKQLSTLTPIIVASNYRIIGDDKYSAEQLLMKTTRFASTIFLIACSVIMLFSWWIVPRLYGEAFTPAVVPLIILMPGVAAFGLSSNLSTYFSGQLGKPAITTGIAFINLIISIPLIYLFTKSFHLIGTAIATTSIYIIGFMPLFFLFIGKSKANPFQLLIIQYEDIKIIQALILRKINTFRPPLNK